MALSSKNPSNATNGNNLIIGGLFIQVLFFGLFVIVAVIFHWRLAGSPTSRSTFPEIKWRKWLALLYVTSALIMVRSVFRVVEYLQGHDGALLRKEVWLYLFDATLMVGVMGVMGWWHPGEVGACLRRIPMEGRDEEEEREEVEMGKWRR